jgi:hypothetical protein
MLDSPGHKADSGPQNARGAGRDSSPRSRNPRAHPSHRGRQPRPRRPGRWWGTRSGGLGISLAAGGAAAGLLGTLLTGSDPGVLLGIFLVTGTAAGALAVRPGAAHLIIPAPPLAYVAAATLAGLVHDHAADTSRTALAISAAQWIASGFLAMTAASLLAIAAAVVRWSVERRRPGGQRRPVIRLPCAIR